MKDIIKDWTKELDHIYDNKKEFIKDGVSYVMFDELEQYNERIKWYKFFINKLKLNEKTFKKHV